MRWAKRRRDLSGPVFGAGVHAEVALDASVPGLVDACAQVDPIFVGHLAAPPEEPGGVRAYGMAELPGAALGDFEDFLGYERGRGGVFERGFEERCEARLLLVDRGTGLISEAARHRGVDDAW